MGGDEFPGQNRSSGFVRVTLQQFANGFGASCVLAVSFIQFIGDLRIVPPGPMQTCSLFSDGSLAWPPGLPSRHQHLK